MLFLNRGQLTAPLSVECLQLLGILIVLGGHFLVPVLIERQDHLLVLRPGVDLGFDRLLQIFSQLHSCLFLAVS